jgi:hypothetical protein
MTAPLPCVIAQQYSSAAFSHTVLDALLKDAVISFFNLF